MSRLQGLATGIGSMPYTEAAPALDLIFRHLPYIPHWPQLPAASENEGFVLQFVKPLIEHRLIVEEKGSQLRFAAADIRLFNEQTAFSEYATAEGNVLPSLNYALPVGSAAGFYAYLRELQRNGTGGARYLKGQISGPVSLGLHITDNNFRAALYSCQLREMLAKALALQARWQIRELSRFNLPVLFFIDDPSLCMYRHPSFPDLSANMIKESLLTVIGAARAEGALVGAHACAAIDWSLLFALPLDVVNIDVYHYFASILPFATELNDYLARGCTMAWGLVPTSPEVENESAQTLLDRLSGNFARLESMGVDGKRLRKQLLFTPSCGTGTLTVAHTEYIYQLLRELSETYLKELSK